MTSPIFRGSTPVRCTSARITVAASSCALTSFNAPPNRPTGVRTGEQTTTSRMSPLLSRQPYVSDHERSRRVFRQVDAPAAGSAGLVAGRHLRALLVDRLVRADTGAVLGCRLAVRALGPL